MIEIRDIEHMFGELLDQIYDKDLRSKTVSTWVEGCRQGGWDSVSLPGIFV